MAGTGNGILRASDDIAVVAEMVLVMATTGAAETVTLPTTNIGVFNAIIDWGDTTTSTITTYNDADLTHEYADAGDHMISIDGLFPSLFFNNGGDRLKLKEVINIGQTGLQKLSFYGCSNMTLCEGFSSTDAALTSMESLFRNVTLASLDLGGMDTSAVDSMKTMFHGASITTLDVSTLDTGAVATTQNMFGGSAVIGCAIDLTGWNVSSLIDMSFMFVSATIPSIDVSNLNTLNVTSMMSTFSDCRATTVNVFGLITSAVTTMFGMFQGARATSLDLSSFDTSLVLNMERLLRNSDATDIDISGFDIEACDNFSFILNNSGMTTTNYDNTLIAWASQTFITDNAVDTIDFGSSKYSAARLANRTTIADNFLTYTDGGQV